jgi:DNA-binding MarR family transcriptional regulator
MQTLQLEAFLPYRVSRLAERVSRSLSRVYADRFGISVPEWRVLATLAESPGLTASAVAARTNLDKVKISRTVGQLEARKLLLRRASASDRRAATLRLSASGKRLFESIVPLAREWEAQLLGGLGAAERRQLFQFISTLEAQLAPETDATTNHVRYGD